MTKGEAEAESHQQQHQQPQGGGGGGAAAAATAAAAAAAAAGGGGGQRSRTACVNCEWHIETSEWMEQSREFPRPHRICRARRSLLGSGPGGSGRASPSHGGSGAEHRPKEGIQ